MLILGSVAALDVTEWWVRVYDAKVTKILQRHQVLALTQAVQPAAAECQGPKVLIDHIQQMFSPWKSATRGQHRDMMLDSFIRTSNLFSIQGRDENRANLIGTCPTLKFFM